MHVTANEDSTVEWVCAAYLGGVVMTPHAVVGALVARGARSPRSAFWRGVVSHFALDRIPHYDYNASNPLLLAADAACAAALVAWLSDRSPEAAAGAVGGLAPDVVQFAERALRIDVTLAMHMANHTDARPGLVAGSLTQVVAVLTAGVLLRR